VKKGLPAIKTLKTENIFIKDKPENNENKLPDKCLNILILNLMPTKIETETQLMRMLSGSMCDINITLMQTFTYTSKNTTSEHLNEFYRVFDDIKINDNYYDGMIITGAPVEHLDFKQVVYWDELCDILKWAKTHVGSIYSICWGAQAVLHYYYGIEKQKLDKKMFGVFEHRVLNSQKNNPLCLGFDDVFYAPHSRFAQVSESDILKSPDLDLIAKSDIAGVHIVASKDLRVICVTGHPEYDRETLSKEYLRDIEKGENIDYPYNYFPQDNPALSPVIRWRAHGSRLFSNWTGILMNKRLNI
jgi:homoserine O-succinyltransferase